jgi:hypothetical protein
MPEESVTVMLLPEDDTETILDKVRRAGAKKINLIVPPGNRALQTLGGFTMLRKACDITGLEVTVYSDDEKARDMAQVCRFEVVSLEQEVRPREVKPPAEEPRIVVSTRPPEPTGAAAPQEHPEELKERLGELSEADLALFDSLEDMSLTGDVELRPEAFGRLAAPAAAVEAPPGPAAAPPKREAPPKEKKPGKPSPFKPIADTLAGALANVYIAVVGLFLKAAARFQPKAAREVPVEAEAPAAVGPRVRTDEEVRALRLKKLRYYLWTLVAVVVLTGLMVGIYLLSQPTVTISLTPQAAETEEMDLALTVALTNSVSPKAAVNVEGGTVSIPARTVQVDLEGQASGSATGDTWIAEGTATGSVVFVNMTSYAVSVPAGTQVAVGGGGVTFHTTDDVWVPASDFRGEDAYLGKAQVNVVADVPGSAGNVDAAAISMVGGGLDGTVTVENSEATSGGSERRTTVVTAQDQENVRRQLVTDLQSRAYDQLKAQTSGLEVLSGTLKIETIEETFSHPVGAEASTITLTARVRAQALVSAPGALDRAVQEAVQQQVQPKQGQEIGQVTYSPIQSGRPGIEANTWTYTTHATAPILNRINDSLRAEIGDRLAGKSYEQARQILAEYRDVVASFSISPVLDWLPNWGGIQVVDMSQIK